MYLSTYVCVCAHKWWGLNKIEVSLYAGDAQVTNLATCTVGCLGACVCMYVCIIGCVIPSMLQQLRRECFEMHQCRRPWMATVALEPLFLSLGTLPSSLRHP